MPKTITSPPDEEMVNAFTALGAANGKAERVLMAARRLHVQDATPTLGQRGALREFVRELRSEAEHLTELADELDAAIDELRFPWGDDA